MPVFSAVVVFLKQIKDSAVILKVACSHSEAHPVSAFSLKSVFLTFYCFSVPF